MTETQASRPRTVEPTEPIPAELWMVRSRTYGHWLIDERDVMYCAATEKDARYIAARESQAYPEETGEAYPVRVVPPDDDLRDIVIEYLPATTPEGTMVLRAREPLVIVPHRDLATGCLVVDASSNPRLGLAISAASRPGLVGAIRGALDGRWAAGEKVVREIFAAVDPE